MAVAIVAIAKEYNYSKQQQGLILASFFFGYIITPIMGGTLADRYGGKPVLAFGAMVWTIFTFVTPLASSAGLFWVVLSRIGLGLGEGVAYPSIHAMIGTWAPPSERSKAVATIWGASDPASCRWITEQERHWILQQQQLDQLPNNGLHRLATAGSNLSDDDLEYLDQTQPIRTNGAPVTYQPIQQNVPHRLSEDSDNEIQATCSSSQSNSDENNLIFRPDTSSSPSLVVQDQQSRWQAFRNQIRSRTAIERRDSGKPNKEPVPWRELLLLREVWAIVLSQLFNSLGFFVMQSWIPTFYLDYYGVDVGKIGYYAVLPSAMQGIVGLMAGYIGDKAVQDWNWTTLAVRRTSQSVGSLGLGVFLLCAVIFAPTAAAAMVLITIGMALNGLTMTGASAYQYNISFYLSYLARWPDLFSVQCTPSSTLMAYVMGKAEGTGTDWHGHVTAITVAPEYRRLGLAQGMMDLLERVSEYPYDGYFVDLFVRRSNKVAIEMYTQLGYSIYRTVRGYYNGDTTEDAFE
ncbi:N(alpha)-acetyltransferase 20, NatB catalytic subunit [Entomortierella lignicola]|nr:N(alpha)-acetyltransferase 20, NatB catalytic subunit [Entomortierella lignicola]